MNVTRKLLTLVLALTMALSLNSTVFAENLEEGAQTEKAAVSTETEVPEEPTEAEPTEERVEEPTTVELVEESTKAEPAEEQVEEPTAVASAEETIEEEPIEAEPVEEPTAFTSPRSGSVIASGTCGANLTWVLTDDYTLTISGKGAMDASPSWFKREFQVLCKQKKLI